MLNHISNLAVSKHEPCDCFFNLDNRKFIFPVVFTTTLDLSLFHSIFNGWGNLANTQSKYIQIFSFHHYPLLTTIVFVWIIVVKCETCSVVPESLQSHGVYSSLNSPGQNTGVCSCSPLQGIFPAQGLNPGLGYCGQILYQLSHKESPRTLEWVAYLFSSRSSWPRNWTGLSCIVGGFFTSWTTREAFWIIVITS